MASYDEFRADLFPVMQKWEGRLKEDWERIKGIDDKTLRLANICEHNRFKNLLCSMSMLFHDDNALAVRYTPQIATVTKMVDKHDTDFENVGDDIERIVCLAEKTLANHNATSCKLVEGYVGLCIDCIKQGDEVIPCSKRAELIARLNKMIVQVRGFTRHGQKGDRGIILQLRENKGDVFCVTCLAVVFSVECEDCGLVFPCSGNSELDVYAPVECPKCKSVHLKKSNKIHRICGHFVDSMEQVRAGCVQCKENVPTVAECDCDGDEVGVVGVNDKKCGCCVQ